MRDNKPENKNECWAGLTEDESRTKNSVLIYKKFVSKGSISMLPSFMACYILPDPPQWKAAMCAAFEISREECHVDYAGGLMQPHGSR